jgi:hypothetical protein
MSGGFVVKDISEGGVSPGLHKCGTPHAEIGDTLGDAGGATAPERILDNVGR